MNFLAPLFLVGALGVALPVVFHLIRRTTRERKVFSSLMFLRATPPRLTQRNRLEHWLLLLLRCLAICLLACGFARPFIRQVFPEPPATQPPKALVILVDTSASMRRADLWSQARAKVEAILNRTAPADRVAIFTFDQNLQPLISFAEWNATVAGERAALAAGRLAQRKPGWAATRLDQALIRAAEILAEADQTDPAGPRQIVLVSDFQEGGKWSALQGQEWPQGVEVVSERVTAKTSNAGLQLLADSSDLSGAGGATRVRVSNAANSQREQFSIGWARRTGEFVTNATEVYVPAGQSRIVSLPAPAGNERADRILLRGDEEDFDNAVYPTATEPTQLVVIYLGEDSPTNTRSPLYFVQRALQSTPRQTIEIITHSPADALPPSQADAASLFILAGPASAATATVLRGELQKGKTVLFSPPTVAAAATLGPLLGQAPLTVEEGAPRNYAMLGEIDFRHPLFTPFADVRFSDFTKIHFWKYRKFDRAQLPNARVVASFDNGDPAMLDLPAGRGRVILFASGWQPADSQLALSTKFVPLLCSLLELGNGTPAASPFITVGDSFPLAAGGARWDSAATVTLPDGSSVKLAAGETNFSQASMPGIYQLGVDGSRKQFAVNLDSAESRTTPLPLDELEQLGVPVPKAAPKAVRVAQNQAALRNADLENRQKLWRWFVLATLGVLLVETGLAGWTTRKQRPKVEATA